MPNSVFISGIAGFIGSHAAKKFRDEGWQVAGCDKKLGTLVEKNVEDLSQFDVLLHCAANIDSLDKRQQGSLEQFNDIALDKEVLEQCEFTPPKRLIWISSCVAALPDPLDPYSTVKACGESMALHYGRTTDVPVYVLRPFSGYGSGQAMSYPFPAICARALRYEDPLAVWSDAVRDWIHVDDIVDYIFAAASGRLPSGVPIPVGTGRSTPFTQLAEMFARAVGYSPKISVLGGKPIGHPRRVLDTEPIIRPKVCLEEGIHRFIKAHAPIEATQCP